MNHDKSDKKESENDIQMYVAKMSHRMCLLFHADGNGNCVHGSVASRKKLMGSMAGWPDLVYVLGNGRVVWIELKTERGVVSQPQREVHAKMRLLGHEIHVVKAATGLEAWTKVWNILKGIDPNV